MKDLNKVILIGRLGADPIQRATKSGISVVHFSIATSRKFKSENGAGESVLNEETQWHQIVAWGKRGESCARYLKKGHKVYVEGSMRSRFYDGKDGKSRLTFEVHADDVGFLGGRTVSSTSSSPSSSTEVPSDTFTEEFSEQTVGQAV